MEKVHLLTLGCPKNLADSELMLGALTSAGFEITLDPEEAQVLLVNTCAFIEAAKKGKGPAETGTANGTNGTGRGKARAGGKDEPEESEEIAVAF